MAIFGVKTQQDRGFHKFMEDCNKRIKAGGVFFEGNIKRLGHTGSNYDVYIIDLRPIVPRTYIAGLVLLGGMFLIKGLVWSWWYLPPVLMSMTYVFYDKYFYYNMLKLSIYHKKLKYKISMVRPTKLMQYIADNI